MKVKGDEKWEDEGEGPGGRGEGEEGAEEEVGGHPQAPGQGHPRAEPQAGEGREASYGLLWGGLPYYGLPWGGL